MDVRVHLDPGLEAEVRERAAASGKDVAAYIAEAVREKLDSDPPPARQISDAEWSRWLEEFVASHADVRRTADDLRESIFEDRGA